MSEVKTARSGYEIRTDILKMALQLETERLHAKYSVLVNSPASKDSVQMKLKPEDLISAEDVVTTATKLYQFVNVK